MNLFWGLWGSALLAKARAAATRSSMIVAGRTEDERLRLREERRERLAQMGALTSLPVGFYLWGLQHGADDAFSHADAVVTRDAFVFVDADLEPDPCRVLGRIPKGELVTMEIESLPAGTGLPRGGDAWAEDAGPPSPRELLQRVIDEIFWPEERRQPGVTPVAGRLVLRWREDGREREASFAFASPEGAHGAERVLRRHLDPSG